MRLNKSIREAIVTAAMKDAFDDKNKALETKELEVADKVYNYLFGEYRKKIDKSGLPKNWFPDISRIRVNHHLYSFYPSDTTMNSYLNLDGARPIPYHLNNYISCIAEVPKENPLYDELTELAESYLNLRKEKQELKASIEAIVRSVTTVKRLLEEWPECKDYISVHIPKPSNSLVSVALINNVNKAIGLPKPTKKAP